jgi:hypothetical protein
MSFFLSFLQTIILAATLCAGAPTPGCNVGLPYSHEGSGIGPKFGTGFQAKPFFTKQGTPGHLTDTLQPQQNSTHSLKGTWSRAEGRDQPPEAPGPGKYSWARDYDSPHQRSHATMGKPHEAKRLDAPVVCTITGNPSRRGHAGGQRSTWNRAPRRQAEEVTPGPSQYAPCTSDFCSCMGCGSTGKGRSFGSRPPVYTGCMRPDQQPGPAAYHMDCTTLGAATRKCSSS